MFSKLIPAALVATTLTIAAVPAHAQYLHGSNYSPSTPPTSAIVQDIGGGMSMIQMDNGQSGVAINMGGGMSTIQMDNGQTGTAIDIGGGMVAVTVD